MENFTMKNVLDAVVTAVVHKRSAIMKMRQEEEHNMEKNVQVTRRITEFATMVRNASDNEVIEMMDSGKVNHLGIPLNILDGILASRLHCRPEDIRLYRTDKGDAF